MKKCVQHLKNHQGFTLLEIIIVVVILGVLAIGVTTYIGFGTQVYTDATDRTEVVSSARFSIERLNREIRSALPNSVRVNGNTAKQCIEFMPIVLSTIYTDIAVLPEPSTAAIKVIAFDEETFNRGFSPALYVGVYILNAMALYDGTNNKVFQLANSNITKVGNEWTISLDSAQTFAEESPTKRLYFFNDAVSYCIQNTRLTRHQNYSRNNDNTPSTSGVLMAEDINIHDNNGVLVAPFKLTKTTQLRNAMVLINLTFDHNNEKVVFNNEIQVLNVP